MNGRMVCLIVPVAVFLGGCATAQTLSENGTKNNIYSGTIRHLELKCAHGTCLDLPFSLAADTLVLPYTIPKTVITNCCSDAGETPNEKSGD